MGLRAGRAGTAVLVLTVAAAAMMQLSPTPTRAGQLRCASRELRRSEKDEAFNRVARVMPTDSGPVFLQSACWNSDFAIAWFRSHTAVDADGVRWWWSAECRRDTARWSCEAAVKERRIDVTVTEDGRATKIVASVPPDFPADRARSIVAISATLAGKQEMPLPACTPSPGDELAWSRFRSFVSALSSQEPAAEIQRTNEGVEVDYSNSLWFRFDDDGQATCWGELVVVS